MRSVIESNPDHRSPLLCVELRHEQDVVTARQRAREVAAAVGFERQDQTRFTTAVSEIARNAYEYAASGRVEFNLVGLPPVALEVRVTDSGPGISDLKSVLSGRYVSKTGMGLGITGARRLSDRFTIDSAPGRGTTVTLEKTLPSRSSVESEADIAEVVSVLSVVAPRSPFEEVRNQNRDLMRALDELQSRQTSLDQLNLELSDTNRGVIALHSQLAQTAEELRMASEMKTRFLSDMSHEFRTPLNSITGLARLLLDYADGPLTPEQAKQVQYILRSAQQLTEIVNDLLDTAKIESGKVTVTPEEFTAGDLFSSLRGVFRPLVDSSSTKVTLTFEPAADLPPIFSDEDKVTQILRNFISNALKFTERGTVSVTCLLASENEILFSVADTGIGIRPEDVERVFEEFAQVDGAVQRRVKGTGLGLPLCRKLAALLGGSVEVTSAVGEGSTFSLRIPLRFSNEDPASGAESTRDEQGAE